MELHHGEAVSDINHENRQGGSLAAHPSSAETVAIWGVTLPAASLSPADTEYLRKVARMERPPVEWIWQEMDRVWDALALDIRAPLQGQAISQFYAHPVWVVNGVFSAVDPQSGQHRDAIARYIRSLDVKRVADYGGGFAELALRLHALDSGIRIDIVEPYSSALGRSRVAGIDTVRFVDSFDEPYDCILAQDVLEHVADPMGLAEQMVQAARPGGFLIFANCFYPVIKCHLPSTFYLRHTFKWLARHMGLEFIGAVDGANHAHVFRKSRRINRVMLMSMHALAKLAGPVLNRIIPLLGMMRRKMRKRA